MTYEPLGEPIPAKLTVLANQQAILGHFYFGIGKDWSFAPEDESLPLQHLDGEFEVQVEFGDGLARKPMKALSKLSWNHGSYDFVAAL